MLKYAWIAIIVILAGSTLRTLWLSFQARQNLSQQEARVERLEQETLILENKLREATASFTLEKRARDELRLYQDGEFVIRLEP
jgi:cell division protein FtsB